jgi:hypothetical protein
MSRFNSSILLKLNPCKTEKIKAKKPKPNTKAIQYAIIPIIKNIPPITSGRALNESGIVLRLPIPIQVTATPIIIQIEKMMGLGKYILSAGCAS